MLAVETDRGILLTPCGNSRRGRARDVGATPLEEGRPLGWTSLRRLRCDKRGQADEAEAAERIRSSPGMR